MARSSLRQLKVQCSKVQCELPPCCSRTQTESQFQSLQLFNRSAPRNAAARSSRSTASLRSRRIRLTSVPRVPKFRYSNRSTPSPVTKHQGTSETLSQLPYCPRDKQQERIRWNKVALFGLWLSFCGFEFRVSGFEFFHE